MNHIADPFTEISKHDCTISSEYESSTYPNENNNKLEILSSNIHSHNLSFEEIPQNFIQMKIEENLISTNLNFFSSLLFLSSDVNIPYFTSQTKNASTLSINTKYDTYKTAKISCMLLCASAFSL